MSRPLGKMMWRTGLFSAALIASGGPVAAHPHVFIEAGIVLTTDDTGRVANVEVTWLYDELYTLLLLQDYALDLDFDGRLTEDEVTATLGFDLLWNSGFQGGLYLTRDGKPLQIGPPDPVAMTLRPDGRMETTHRRPVFGDPGQGVVEAQVYDEAFFISFEATLPSVLSGTTQCQPNILSADLDAAYDILAAQVMALGGAIAAEDNFPAVGALFADTLIFECAP